MWGNASDLARNWRWMNAEDSEMPPGSLLKYSGSFFKMLLKESLQKHEKAKENNQWRGWGGKGLQSNNFCVVNYLICIPCIGTLILSTSDGWNRIVTIRQFHWQLLRKFFKVFFNFVWSRAPNFFFPSLKSDIPFTPPLDLLVVIVLWLV